MTILDENEMQGTLEAMRGYFSDEAWAKWGAQYFYDWPSAACAYAPSRD